MGLGRLLAVTTMAAAMNAGSQAVVAQGFYGCCGEPDPGKFVWESLEAPSLSSRSTAVDLDLALVYAEERIRGGTLLDLQQAYAALDQIGEFPRHMRPHEGRLDRAMAMGAYQAAALLGGKSAAAQAERESEKFLLKYFSRFKFFASPVPPPAAPPPKRSEQVEGRSPLDDWLFCYNQS